MKLSNPKQFCLYTYPKCGTSVYDAMKLWSKQVFPNTSRWDWSSSREANAYLDVISGVPIGRTYALRNFLKVIAANELAKLLSGKTPDIDPYRLQIRDAEIWKGDKTQLLLPHSV